jgi:hypothetical protein
LDGLKRSLEKAIEELRETPQVVQTSQPPGPKSIEAALASAPAVSPHYVPPPPPKPVVTETPARSLAPASKEDTQPTTKNGQAAQALESDPRKNVTRLSGQPILKRVAAMPTALGWAQGGKKTKPVKRADQTDRSSLPDGIELDDAAKTPAAKTVHDDNMWRWTTIAISCVGGLASGWLGSTFSDQLGGLFRSEVPHLVGQASKTATRSTASGAMKISSSSDTGKSDRAVPMDENLCTVLELDRGTGLTLSKPCRSIETAEFTSKLNKSDLLAKP